MTYAEQFRALQNDPSVSYWLKDALRALDKRDPLDALNDVDQLSALVTQRWNELAK